MVVVLQWWCPWSTCIASARYLLNVLYAGSSVFDRVVVCGWLWLMCGACLLIAVCIGGGVAMAVPIVHLHRFIALHLICSGDRVELVWSSWCVWFVVVDVLRLFVDCDLC